MSPKVCTKLSTHQVCVIRAIWEQGLRLAFNGAKFHFLNGAGEPTKAVGFVALGREIRTEAVQALISKGYLVWSNGLVVPTKRVKEHFADKVA